MSLWKPKPRKTDPSATAPTEVREAARKLDVTARASRMQTTRAKRALDKNSELLETMESMIQRLGNDSEEGENDHA